MPDTSLTCGGRILALERPVVMGILNVTPDSFSDGGRFNSLPAALDRAQEMIEQGATFIDVGGESTRPGAVPVPEAEELRRVIPVIEAIVSAFPVLVSVDTSSPQVMREAARVGAHLINDVRALQRPGALEAAADTGLGVCLMHMQGEPATMQLAPHYSDVCSEVLQFLRQRMEACVAAGIEPGRICVDPGFGFGKTLVHNVQLLRGLEKLEVLGRPILVGLSRKSIAGQLAAGGAHDRTAASVALAALAVAAGASIVRAHDVAPTRAAIQVAAAVRAGTVGPISLQERQ